MYSFISQCHPNTFNKIIINKKERAVTIRAEIELVIV